MDFTASLLWKHTLVERLNDTMSGERNRLRSSYLTFRERAGELATEIGVTLPRLTKHDLSHIDALSELSSELVRDELSAIECKQTVLGFTCSTWSLRELHPAGKGYGR